MRDPLVRVFIDAAVHLARLDRPNTARIKARALAALEHAGSAHDIIDATKNVIRLFGDEVTADGGDDDALPNLSGMSQAVKIGVRGGVVNRRTGEVVRPKP